MNHIIKQHAPFLLIIVLLAISLVYFAVFRAPAQEAIFLVGEGEALPEFCVPPGTDPVPAGKQICAREAPGIIFDAQVSGGSFEGSPAGTIPFVGDDPDNEVEGNPDNFSLKDEIIDVDGDLVDARSLKLSGETDEGSGDFRTPVIFLNNKNLTDNTNSNWAITSLLPEIVTGNPSATEPHSLFIYTPSNAGDGSLSEPAMTIFSYPDSGGGSRFGLNADPNSGDALKVGGRTRIQGRLVIENDSVDNAVEINSSNSGALLYVLDDGNVGIGTGSPAYLLDIQGTTALLNVANGGDGLNIQSNGVSSFNANSNTVTIGGADSPIKATTMPTSPPSFTTAGAVCIDTNGAFWVDNALPYDCQ